MAVCIYLIRYSDRKPESYLLRFAMEEVKMDVAAGGRCGKRDGLWRGPILKEKLAIGQWSTMASNKKVARHA
jgi:hypothetical protein